MRLDEVKQKCSWFKEFDEVLGSNATITPPFLAESRGPSSHNSTYVNSPQTPYSPDILHAIGDPIEPDSFTSVDIEDTNITEHIQSPDVETSTQDISFNAASQLITPYSSTPDTQKPHSASNRKATRSRKHISLLDIDSDSDEFRRPKKISKSHKSLGIAEAIVQVAKIQSQQAALQLQEQARIANQQMEAQKLEAEERREQARMQHEEKMKMMELQLKAHSS